MRTVHRPRYSNRVARSELRGRHPLKLSEGFSRFGDPAARPPLLGAIRAASLQGLRRLVSLTDGEHSVSVAVVPLAPPSLGSDAPILIVLGKRSMCEKLSVHWFAVSHGLTPAERTVLERLAEGLDATDIARDHRVALSTVRTQIASLRLKTHSDSVGHLLRQMAMLPPILSILRSPSASDI